LERQLREAEALDTSTYPRARALFDEAKQVGLVDDRLAPVSYEIVFAALQRVARDDRVRDELIVGMATTLSLPCALSARACGVNWSA
jgi:hypothetical protein